jgi:hypothetical protein
MPITQPLEATMCEQALTAELTVDPLAGLQRVTAGMRAERR